MLTAALRLPTLKVRYSSDLFVLTGAACLSSPYGKRSKFGACVTLFCPLQCIDDRYSTSSMGELMLCVNVGLLSVSPRKLTGFDDCVRRSVLFVFSMLCIVRPSYSNKMQRFLLCLSFDCFSSPVNDCIWCWMPATMGELDHNVQSLFEMFMASSLPL